MGNYKLTDVGNPISGNDAVNYHTLLEAIPTSIRWYLSNTASALAGHQKLLLTNDVGQTELTLTVDASPKAVGSWITDAGVPAYTTIPAGEYKFHLYGKVNSITGTDRVQYRAKWYYVDADGTSNKTQIGGDSTLTAYVTTSILDFNVDIHVESAITVADTKRLVLDVTAVKTEGGGNPTLYTYLGAATDAYIGEPATAITLNNIFVRKTGDETIAGVKTFSDGIVIGTDKLVKFRDADTWISSQTAEYLDLNAKAYIRFNNQATPIAFVDAAGFHTYSGKYIQIIEAPLYMSNNQAFNIRNAANNAWLECLKLDSSNILQVGSAAVAVESVTTQPKTDNSYYLGKNDDDSPKAWKGLILKDQAGTGKYYRLEVYGDALRIVDLTD
jgi:hypothetical protein